jgi:hypothetical protein
VSPVKRSQAPTDASEEPKNCSTRSPCPTARAAAKPAVIRDGSRGWRRSRSIWGSAYGPAAPNRLRLESFRGVPRRPRVRAWSRCSRVSSTGSWLPSLDIAADSGQRLPVARPANMLRSPIGARRWRWWRFGEVHGCSLRLYEDRNRLESAIGRHCQGVHRHDENDIRRPGRCSKGRRHEQATDKETRLQR